MTHWINEFVGINISSDRVAINGPMQDKEHKNTSVYVIGDVYGAYVNGRVWDPRVLAQYLVENAEGEVALEKILRKVVGDFFVVISTEKKTIVFTTPGGHGLFYTTCGGKYIISDVPEGLFPFIKSYTVSDYEVLQWVILDGVRPIPFRYIFEEIRCLMGGSRLCIAKDGSTRVDVYIFPPTEPNCTYEMFVNSLEGTAKVIVAECEKRKKPIYCMFSGGIDSAASALSIMSVGGKVTLMTMLPARYRDLEGYEVTYALATHSAEAMGLPLKIVPFDEFDEKVINKQFEHFGSSLYSGDYTTLACFSNPDLFANTDPLIFSGDGMDTIYAISHPKPPFKLPLAFENSRLVLNQGYFLGMQYAKWFQSAVAQATPFWKRAYPILARRRYIKDLRLPLNAYEYLTNMMISTKLLTIHSDKLLNSVLSTKGLVFRADNTSSFLKTPTGRKFVEYKFQTVIKEMLRDADLLDLEKNNLSLIKFNSIIRRLAYSTFFWQSLLGAYVSAQKLNYSYFPFPFQGPLSDVFSGFYAGLREVSFPKLFEYKYFAERTKKRYSFTATDSLPVERNQRKHLPMVKHRDLFIKSKPYTDRMLPFMNPKESVLLDLLKEKDIREFVHSAYADVWKNVRDNAALWPMLCRLYQLESHVRYVLGG